MEKKTRTKVFTEDTIKAAKDKAAKAKAAKKAKAKEKAKADKEKQQKMPKALSLIKRYVKDTFKKEGWSGKSYRFPDSPFSITDFEITEDIDNRLIHVNFKLKYNSRTAFAVRNVHASYGYKNFKTLKSDIKKAYDDVKNQKMFTEKNIKRKALEKQGWMFIY